MLRTLSRLAVSVIAAATSVPMATAANMPRGVYAVADHRGVAYGPYSQNVLDECVPVPKPGQWAGPFPAMVFIHGGGWTAGDRTYHSVDCNVWASYGFVAFTIDYRLLRYGDPSTWWPVQLIDSQAAIRWIRTQAVSLNVAPDHVYTLGDSAGGQLVEYLGYQPATVPGDLAGLYPHVSSHVQYVIAEFAPSLFGPGAAQPGAPDPLTYDLITPANRTTAATLLVQGTQDTTVSPDNSTAVYDQLRAYGRPASYLPFDGQHEFVGMTSLQIVAVEIQEINAAMRQAKYFHAMPANLPGPVMPAP